MGWKGTRSFVSSYANVCGSDSSPTNDYTRSFTELMQGITKTFVVGSAEYQTVAGTVYTNILIYFFRQIATQIEKLTLRDL